MDVKFKYGSLSDIPSTIDEGTIYVCTNGIIYVDLNNTRIPFKCSQAFSLTVDGTTYTYDGSTSTSATINTIHGDTATVTNGVLVFSNLSSGQDTRY